MRRPALLALADGTVYRGYATGVDGSTVGEVVFNTAITGYQEILTDPSYAQQIVTLTHPHIGNTGINHEDNESDRIWAAGLIVRDVPNLVSNWRSEQSLPEFLEEQNRVGIGGVDTRALTRRLRDSGAQGGCILAGAEAAVEDAATTAISAARGFAGLAGLDLAQVVSSQERYEWGQGEWQLGVGFTTPEATPYHVVALDFGVKRNILRMLASRGCRLTVLPAQSDYDTVMAAKPDGVFLSNGPGDPEPCDYAIELVKRLFTEQPELPMFGICLGYQIMALASGATTMKMSHGHHGANHPIKDLRTSEVLITSQNHGFTVAAEGLPDNLAVSHVSLFDGTLQGLRRVDRPAFGVQGHPEASPGPHDLGGLFDQFVSLMAGNTNA